MCYILRPATAADADSIATLHAESWRSAYRGIFPDDYLDNRVLDERRALWQRRMRQPNPERCLVLMALDGATLCGFVCVLLDAEPQYGVLLDNLHVRPELKGTGLGKILFDAAHDWVRRTVPDVPMSLWVLEANVRAQRFYDRQGGRVVEKKVVEVVPGIHVPELRYEWRRGVLNARGE